MNKEQFKTIASKLPLTPGIQGRDKYFNSAVMIPFVFMDGEYHLLFQKRAVGISQGGEICFPGGKHDPLLDKDLKSTAIREMSEELGIAPSDVEVLGQLDTLVAPIGAIVESFVGALDESVLPKIKIDTNEVEAIFTIPLSYFIAIDAEKYHARLEVQPSFFDKTGNEIVLLPSKALQLPERYHKPWGGHHYRILVYKTYHGVIWGITAEIIHELLDYLSNHDI